MNEDIEMLAEIVRDVVDCAVATHMGWIEIGSEWPVTVSIDQNNIKIKSVRVSGNIINGSCEVLDIVNPDCNVELELRSELVRAIKAANKLRILYWRKPIRIKALDHHTSNLYDNADFLIDQIQTNEVSTRADVEHHRIIDMIKEIVRAL